MWNIFNEKLTYKNKPNVIDLYKIYLLLLLSVSWRHWGFKQTLTSLAFPPLPF